MKKIASSIEELIGGTPLLRLERYGRFFGLKSDIIAKLEYFNPLGSIKDRVALALINDAESRGVLKEDTLIIEPTSGNTGIGLAYISAVRGYRLVLTMPESMSLERRLLLSALGAELVLTPAAEGMNGAVNRAFELAQEHGNAFIPQQFDNEANPRAHEETTAPEICRDLGGPVDYFVATVGTGGTVSGVGRALKSRYPGCKVIAVEPEGSPLLSQGRSGPHKIQGIGANFVPKNLDRTVIDEIIRVSDEDAYTACRELARLEGLLVGISSGAACKAAAVIAARPENSGKSIVAVFPDTGERYLSSGLYEGAGEG